MKRTVFGLLIGLGGAMALSRLMQSLLFKVRSTDPLIFATVSMFLTGVVLLACWVPAQRAARIDPMRALRHE